MIKKIIKKFSKLNLKLLNLIFWFFKKNINKPNNNINKFIIGEIAIKKCKNVIINAQKNKPIIPANPK